MLPAFAYIRAESLQDAVDRAATGNSQLHAGGTDLVGCLRDGVFTVDTVVSLGGIQGLASIRETDGGGLAIGAMTPVAAVAASPAVNRLYPGLAQAAAEVGSPQLRAQGTLGGNLCQKPRCWYYRGDFDCLRKGGDLCYAINGENAHHCILGGANCYIVHPSDTAPALVAFDAEVKIKGPNGVRRLPVADLHMPPAEDPTRETRLEPGEVIVEIVLPKPPQGAYSSYRKVRTRRSWDFALAGCALALAMDGDTVRDARVVLAGAAPVPWRSREAEESLRGRRLDDAAIQSAARAAMAAATPLPHNGYKVPLFEGMLEEELARAAAA